MVENIAPRFFFFLKEDSVYLGWTLLFKKKKYGDYILIEHADPDCVINFKKEKADFSPTMKVIKDFEFKDKEREDMFNEKVIIGLEILVDQCIKTVRELQEQ